MMQIVTQKSETSPSVYDLGRIMELPTLPTLPLVFLTPLLLSVLRRDGLDRVLPTLIFPSPLPLFSLPGVFGRAPVGAVFSASLSPPMFQDVFVTLMEVVVVQLIALRCFSFGLGDRDVVFRTIISRIW